MSENGEIYTAGKNFTLPPALTAWTNSISGGGGVYRHPKFVLRNKWTAPYTVFIGWNTVTMFTLQRERDIE